MDQQEPTNTPTPTPSGFAGDISKNTPSTKPRSRWLHPKRLITYLVILLVLVAGIMLLNKHHTNPAVAATGGNVSITPTGFLPQEIHIKKNQTITWTNNDASKAHQVKADPYPTGESLPNLDSGPLNNTDSYTYTYEQTGTFTYHDQQDPYKLQGKVVVE